MIQTEPYLDFLIKYKLTQEQYLLLHLIYEKRKDLINRYKQTFPTEEGHMISKYLIKDLLDRNFIVKTKTGYILGEKFLSIFVNADVATDEVFDAYPPFMINEGVSIPLISMDKNIFAKIYIAKINGSYQEHKEIIKDIHYARQHDLIKMGINKFLTSEQWKVYRKLRVPENPGAPTSLTENINNIDNDF